MPSATPASRICGPAYRLVDLFRGECEKWEFKLAEAFPEPPGMEAVRKELESRGLKEEEKSFEVPVQVP